MNRNDLISLEQLNERYTPANLTGFRIVNENTSKNTVLKHIKNDLNVLNTCGVKNKHVSRVIVSNSHIDICTADNGTFISYFFMQDSPFTPDSLNLSEICENISIERL
ncbi:hypothetical protein [uncultured Methanobrevibacter sp.]|uniref:hypothetical protein n=1 Tax=uncultured Methanobrevibacter sp. TaxID=253161 RepID=UPI0025E610EA|nr:hypothetical protein [uncultured Methanobrevibacter sp.]